MRLKASPALKGLNLEITLADPKLKWIKTKNKQLGSLQLIHTESGQITLIDPHL